MPFDPLAGSEEAEQRPLWQRIAWLVVIWAASVAALGVVAYILRLWLV